MRVFNVKVLRGAISQTSYLVVDGLPHYHAAHTVRRSAGIAKGPCFRKEILKLEQFQGMVCCVIWKNISVLKKEHRSQYQRWEIKVPDHLIIRSESSRKQKIVAVQKHKVFPFGDGRSLIASDLGTLVMLL